MKLKELKTRLVTFKVAEDDYTTFRETCDNHDKTMTQMFRKWIREHR